MARVVVDAMGGDQGVSAILEGAARLSMEDNAIQMVLVGNADTINEQLEERQHNPRKIQVVHAPESIDMDEDGSGEVDLEEFTQWWATKGSSRSSSASDGVAAERISQELAGHRERRRELLPRGRAGEPSGAELLRLLASR